MFPKRSHSVSGHSSSETVQMEGVLEKKKMLGSSKLHCILREGKLWYYEDKGRESFIDISHAQSVREGKAKFSFEIITSSRTHAFTADNQVLRDKWIACLREAMRVSSRKMSAVTYIETDEDSVSNSARSSLVVKPPPLVTALKPNVASTLPAALITRTPMKSPTKEGTAHLGKLSMRSSEAESKLQSGKAEPKVEELIAVKKETVASTVDDKKNEIKIDADSAKNENAAKSVNSSNYETVICADDGSRSNERSRDDRSTITSTSIESAEGSTQDEIVTHTASSLYANNAEVRKFLSEQKASADGSRSSTAEPPQSMKSAGSSRSDGFGAGRSTFEASERQDSKDADEDSDEVFPLSSDKPKLVEPPPVVRRRSRSSTTSDSFQVEEIVVAEPLKVELEVGFAATPIPDLPHPRVRLNSSSAFADIRSFLSTQSTKHDDLFSSSIQSGCAMETLKSFLIGLQHI